MPCLTPNQQKALEWIDQFIRDHGYSPSLRELMDFMGWRSFSTANKCIDKLIRFRFLRRTGVGRRDLEIVRTTDGGYIQRPDVRIESRGADHAVLVNGVTIAVELERRANEICRALLVALDRTQTGEDRL